MPVMVQQGLSWRVLLSGWVGLIMYRAWIPALLAGAATMFLDLIVPPPWQMAAILCLHVGLAAFTPDLRIWDLTLHGRRLDRPVVAMSRKHALLRWFDRQRTIQPPELPCTSS